MQTSLNFGVRLPVDINSGGNRAKHATSSVPSSNGNRALEAVGVYAGKGSNNHGAQSATSSIVTRDWQAESRSIESGGMVENRHDKGAHAGATTRSQLSDGMLAQAAGSSLTVGLGPAPIAGPAAAAGQADCNSRRQNDSDNDHHEDDDAGEDEDDDSGDDDDYDDDDEEEGENEFEIADDGHNGQVNQGIDLDATDDVVDDGLLRHWAQTLFAMGQELKCAICLSIYKQPAAPSCGHCCCWDCWKTMISTQRSAAACVVCRQKVTLRGLERNGSIQQVVDCYRALWRIIGKEEHFKASQSQQQGGLDASAASSSFAAPGGGAGDGLTATGVTGEGRMAAMRKIQANAARRAREAAAAAGGADGSFMMTQLPPMTQILSKYTGAADRAGLYNQKNGGGSRKRLSIGVAAPAAGSGFEADDADEDDDDGAEEEEDDEEQDDDVEDFSDDGAGGGTAGPGPVPGLDDISDWNLADNTSAIGAAGVLGGSNAVSRAVQHPPSSTPAASGAAVHSALSRSSGGGAGVLSSSSLRAAGAGTAPSAAADGAATSPAGIGLAGVVSPIGLEYSPTLASHAVGNAGIHGRDTSVVLDALGDDLAFQQDRNGHIGSIGSFTAAALAADTLADENQYFNIQRLAGGHADSGASQRNAESDAHRNGDNAGVAGGNGGQPAAAEGGGDDSSDESVAGATERTKHLPSFQIIRRVPRVASGGGAAPSASVAAAAAAWSLSIGGTAVGRAGDAAAGAATSIQSGPSLTAPSLTGPSQSSTSAQVPHVTSIAAGAVTTASLPAIKVRFQESQNQIIGHAVVEAGQGAGIAPGAGKSMAAEAALISSSAAAAQAVKRYGRWNQVAAVNNADGTLPSVNAAAGVSNNGVVDHHPLEDSIESWQHPAGLGISTQGGAAALAGLTMGPNTAGDVALSASPQPRDGDEYIDGSEGGVDVSAASKHSTGSTGLPSTQAAVTSLRRLSASSSSSASAMRSGAPATAAGNGIGSQVVAAAGSLEFSSSATTGTTPPRSRLPSSVTVAGSKVGGSHDRDALKTIAVQGSHGRSNGAGTAGGAKSRLSNGSAPGASRVSFAHGTNFGDDGITAPDTEALLKDVTKAYQEVAAEHDHADDSRMGIEELDDTSGAASSGLGSSRGTTATSASSASHHFGFSSASTFASSSASGAFATSSSRYSAASSMSTVPIPDGAACNWCYSQKLLHKEYGRLLCCAGCNLVIHQFCHNSYIDDDSSGGQPGDAESAGSGKRTKTLNGSGVSYGSGLDAVSPVASAAFAASSALSPSSSSLFLCDFCKAGMAQEDTRCPLCPCAGYTALHPKAKAVVDAKVADPALSRQAFGSSLSAPTAAAGKGKGKRGQSGAKAAAAGVDNGGEAAHGEPFDEDHEHRDAEAEAVHAKPCDVLCIGPRETDARAASLWRRTLDGRWVHALCAFWITEPSAHSPAELLEPLLAAIDDESDGAAASNVAVVVKAGTSKTSDGTGRKAVNSAQRIKTDEVAKSGTATAASASSNGDKKGAKLAIGYGTSGFGADAVLVQIPASVLAEHANEDDKPAIYAATAAAKGKSKPSASSSNSGSKRASLSLDAAEGDGDASDVEGTSDITFVMTREQRLHAAINFLTSLNPSAPIVCDLHMVDKRRYESTMTCTVCGLSGKEIGATLHCTVKACRKAQHVMCAVRAGLAVYKRPHKPLVKHKSSDAVALSKGSSAASDHSAAALAASSASAAGAVALSSSAASNSLTSTGKGKNGSKTKAAISAASAASSSSGAKKKGNVFGGSKGASGRGKPLSKLDTMLLAHASSPVDLNTPPQSRDESTSGAFSAAGTGAGLQFRHGLTHAAAFSMGANPNTQSIYVADSEAVDALDVDEGGNRDLLGADSIQHQHKKLRSSVTFADSTTAGAASSSAAAQAAPTAQGAPDDGGDEHRDRNEDAFDDGFLFTQAGGVMHSQLDYVPDTVFGAHGEMITSDDDIGGGGRIPGGCASIGGGAPPAGFDDDCGGAMVMGGGMEFADGDGGDYGYGRVAVAAGVDSDPFAVPSTNPDSAAQSTSSATAVASLGLSRSSAASHASSGVASSAASASTASTTGKRKRGSSSAAVANRGKIAQAKKSSRSGSSASLAASGRDVDDKNNTTYDFQVYCPLHTPAAKKQREQEKADRARKLAQQREVADAERRRRREEAERIRSQREEEREKMRAAEEARMAVEAEMARQAEEERRRRAAVEKEERERKAMLDRAQAGDARTIYRLLNENGGGSAPAGASSASSSSAAQPAKVTGRGRAKAPQNPSPSSATSASAASAPPATAVDNSEPTGQMDEMLDDGGALTTADLESGAAASASYQSSTAPNRSSPTALTASLIPGSPSDQIGPGVGPLMGLHIAYLPSLPLDTHRYDCQYIEAGAGAGAAAAALSASGGSAGASGGRSARGPSRQQQAQSEFAGSSGASSSSAPLTSDIWAVMTVADGGKADISKAMQAATMGGVIAYISEKRVNGGLGSGATGFSRRAWDDSASGNSPAALALGSGSSAASAGAGATSSAASSSVSAIPRSVAAPLLPLTHLVVAAVKTEVDISTLVDAASAVQFWNPPTAIAAQKLAHESMNLSFASPAASSSRSGSKSSGDASSSASSSLHCFTVWLARRQNQRYLAGIMSGCYIVTPAWIESCVKECGGTIAHERPYLIAGDKEDKAPVPLLRAATLLGPRSQQLLSDGVAAAASAKRQAEGAVTSGAGGARRSSSSSSLSNSRASVSSQLQYPYELSAPARARAAIESGNPADLLFAGMTFILFGEWECPPKNVSTMDAFELITLGGGRVLELRLNEVPESSTPSASDLRSASASAATSSSASAAAAGHSSSSSSALVPVRLMTGLRTRLDSGIVDAAGEEAAEWRALIVALAGMHPQAVGSNPSSGGAGPSSSSSSSTSATSSSGRRVPPLVILCDEPHFQLPPPVRALLSHSPNLLTVLTPQWLLDTVSCYCLLAPVAQRGHLHPAYANWLVGK